MNLGQLVHKTGFVQTGVVGTVRRKYIGERKDYKSRYPRRFYTAHQGAETV